MRRNNQRNWNEKHNTKRTLNAFNRLTLWVLTYFALSVAFAVDVVVVYLFSLAYYLPHKFICILIRSLLYCIAFQCISWHSATFQCIFYCFGASLLFWLCFSFQNVTKEKFVRSRNTSVTFYIWLTIWSSLNFTKANWKT